MTHYLRQAIVPAFLVLCLLLGGASAAGIWENMGLQIAALAIICWSFVVRSGNPVPPSGRQLIALAALMVLIGLLQLVPLPPAVWTALPGRDEVARGFEMVGQPLPWLPLSLAPARTIASLLWLLPSIAILIGIVLLGYFRGSWIAWTIAAVSAASVAVGALQIAGGDASPWYFYQITNYGVGTGFFANANHLATLLVVTIPFLAALYLNATRKGRSAQRASGLLVILIGSLAVVMVGIVINRSLAGMGLMVPAAVASGLMILSRKRKLPAWTAAVVGLFLAGAVAAVYFAPIANNLTSTSARNDPSSRYVSFEISSKAAADFMPFGSGIGTFPQVYPSYENPATINRFYMNHVHGDYIELALETGLLGIALIMLFLAWWTRRALSIWRAEERDHFALAATIASGVILAHSLVDYPLRTAAIGAVFAACCALMAEPRARVRQRRSEEVSENKARHLSAD
jgi:O-antigen ligase